ncbi:calcium-binding protein [Rhodovulum euryhalinum]|uniref:Hemolysin type calcium-binding protein n=1 Tax=Rhodovulum euryhalinum TaxID=35805 RepID=A0A4R2KBF1_9RHOB|nr:calcium-binding protein [Rhodovulum euryhalinum]TCO70811.1 hemolysin type calcium-binding protein [Rhodovulum euryhalinum]
MQTLGIDIAFGNRVVGAETVTADQFGGIQTGYSGFGTFDAQFTELGLSTLRWPGGTLAETDPDVYGFDIDGLFDGTQLNTPDPDRVRPDLSETLAHCVENELGFSMIIPTLRYADDIDRGVAELAAFLQDLLSGRYGALPADFTLEIGNEYMAHSVLAADPGLYGAIADRFIATIAEALASPAINILGADLTIAVQMGANAADDAAIRAEIAPENLVHVDSLVAHALPFNFGAIDKVEDDPDAHAQDYGETAWQNRADYLAAWSAAITAAGGDGAGVELFMSAMNVGKAAQDLADVNLNYQDYGLRAAGAYLELFATYQSIGMDAAAIWGIAGKQFNAVSHEVDGAIVLDPGGALLMLMAGNIEGMALVDGFQANTRDDLAMAYAWENDAEAVIFLAANDIAADGLGIDLDLGLLTDAVLLEAVRLSAVLSEDTPPGATGLDLMVYEEARLEALVPVVQGDVLSFAFGADYEVVMLRLAKTPVPADPTPVEGGSRADTIDGTAGADVILGHGGNDKLYGNDGDDLLVGGAGNDLLRGGLGDDRLEGEAGNDRLHAGAGQDTVFGGDGDDEILGHGDDDLLLGELGNDTILGGAGADRIDGGDGADWIDGEIGDDRIHGGAGQDALYGGLGSDTIFGGADDDLLDGAGGFDALYGGAGGDTLLGGDGNDVLAGDDGDDHLDGGTGHDALAGGAGADTLRGDLGDDVLSGGAGADLFVFDTAGFGTDRIDDFAAGLDLIDLCGLGLGLSWAGFASACLSEDAFGVTVTAGGGAIDLAGVALADLSEADFLI